MQNGTSFKAACARVSLAVFLVILTLSHADAAEVIATNRDGLVIKRVSCKPYNPVPEASDFRFSVVNRNSAAISGTLTIRGVDSDGDPVVSYKATISIEPASGEALKVNFHCSLAKKFLFSFK